MTDTDPGAPPANGIHFRPRPEQPGRFPGEVLAELYLEGEYVSGLEIIPLTIRVGAAVVRMDGIGGVETKRAHRKKGYSRSVIEASIERMSRGDAALTMLYGIPDFYPKFGFTTAGGDHLVSLRRLWRERAIPTGWHVRPFEVADLPHVQRLYELGTRDSVGAAVRGEGSQTWEHLISTREGDGPAGCRVAVDAAGQIRAYAWRAQHLWYARMIERRERDAFVLSEVMADSPAAADVILTACRLWARELSEGRGDPYREVLIGLPPEGHVAAAAALDDARFTRDTARTADSMARVLDVQRLLDALAPELRQRLARSGVSSVGTLRVVTDIGEGTVSLAESGATATVTLPQTALAKLALGAGDPADLLARLDPAPDPSLHSLLVALFPARHQHMYWPDRY